MNKQKINVYDRVSLIEKFDNPIVYIVAKIRESGIISLFPETGGILVSAHIKNLRRCN